MPSHKIVLAPLLLLLLAFFSFVPDSVASLWDAPDNKPLVAAPSPSPSPSASAPISNPSYWGSPVPAKMASSPIGMKGAYWRSDLENTFPPSAIDTSYFTHIYYAFASIDSTSYELVVTENDRIILSNFTATLHSRTPPVKALLSIGGGGARPETFALMAGNSSTRAAFIASTISVARKYDLDGLDLDWEFPANPQEMESLGHLFAESGAAFSQEAKATGQPRLLLSAAVYFANNFFLSGVPRSYPAASIRENVDWVNAMCYDYHGSWDTSATGAHAALYDRKSQVSTSYGIQSWINAGVPPKQIVMGLPLYGRTWQLKDPREHGIGAPAVGVGPGQGVIIFSEIVDFNRANNATVVFDATTVSTYSYTGTSWIGYDDATSSVQKINYAKENSLAGYFFWALGYDEEWTISSHASSAWDQ